MFRLTKSSAWAALEAQGAEHHQLASARIEPLVQRHPPI